MNIYYPFKPFNITQVWGYPNPAYAIAFNNPNFKRHNGVDANASFSNQFYSSTPKTWPVYCPVEGFVVESVSYEPEGGGNEISLISKEKMQIGDRLCYVRIWLCHAEKVLVPVGYEPKLGELLMIADSTGFSTGAHTHMGMYRCDDNKKAIDTNEATGSYNPALFFTKTYAIDQASLTTLIKSNWRYYQYMLSRPS